MSRELPLEIEKKLKRAARLEWWTLFWMLSIIGVMYFAMGSSQAMKTAWIEDTLSLIPPILFLAARRFERMAPTRAYPFGFHRIGSLAFFFAATALMGMGLFLIYEAGRALILAEHPSIGDVTLFGFDIWLGWVMIAALVYSVIPPVILGRMKKPLAHATMDKVLYTDADMNAADWKTGLAGIAGIIGIAFGLWWADALAAGLIAFDILRDGLRNMRISVAELLDGAPRELATTRVHPIVDELQDEVARRFPGAGVEVRETGRWVRANVIYPDRELSEAAARALLGDEAWRLQALGEHLQDLPGPQETAREKGAE
ncbi:cation transporter [Sulfitobacter aestuarii]|uniref:Cation transporter n=1 Tax=Sulfitobacter aestuarii TaxID=2161676 RepID=A0ABW5U2M1_9RHOB